MKGEYGMDLGQLRDVRLKAACWIALFVIQVLLMIFFVTGEDVHEYLAFPFVLLAAIHLTIAGWWFKWFRLQWGSVPQAVNSAVSLLLIADLLAAFVSGLLISRYATPFLRVRAWQPWLLPAHMVTTFWCLTLSLAHAGLHFSSALSQFWGRRLPHWAKIGSAAVLALWTAYGIRVFFELGIWKYLIRRVAFYNFDADIPEYVWLFQFTSVAVAIGVLAWCAGALLKRIRS